MKKIVLTGGGTAGHVTPNIALIPELQKNGYEVHYIGSYDGIEKKLIEGMQIPYYGISSGKLRRYFDPKNFSDPVKVLKGGREALSLLKKIKPDVVFSKGGLAAVPGVYAATLGPTQSVLHESDMTPGLANKLCIPFASRICANFPEALEALPKNKSILTGTPIRKELFCGNREKGLQFCGFSSDKPVLLVIGGSLGATNINQAVRTILPKLLREFQVIHLCGKGKLVPELEGTKGYVQYEYIEKELRDLFAAADLVISRAGANAICELLALRIPNILIPLPASASRGDQILNANSFVRQGFSYLLEEESMTEDTLLTAIHETYANRDKYRAAMADSQQNDAIAQILDMIKELTA